MVLRDFDRRKVVEEIIDYIGSKYSEAGAEKLVLGLSGGLDSSVTADLCKRAVGGGNVLGLYLPTTKDLDLPREVSEFLGIEFEELGLSTDYREIYDTLRKDCSHYIGEKVSLGNIKARLRMIFIYYHSNLLNGLVVGTGNKSEFEVGYFTKYGDGAADFFPIADLYKTQVKEVGKYLDLPQEIIEKTPSAGLWKGQTDEEELGIPYKELDPILYSLERDWSKEKIKEKHGVSLEKINKVIEMKRCSKHKREPASKLEIFN